MTDPCPIDTSRSNPKGGIWLQRSVALDDVGRQWARAQSHEPGLDFEQYIDRLQGRARPQPPRLQVEREQRPHFSKALPPGGGHRLPGRQVQPLDLVEQQVEVLDERADTKPAHRVPALQRRSADLVVGGGNAHLMPLARATNMPRG